MVTRWLPNIPPVSINLAFTQPLIGLPFDFPNRLHWHSTLWLITSTFTFPFNRLNSSVNLSSNLSTLTSHLVDCSFTTNNITTQSYPTLIIHFFLCSVIFLRELNCVLVLIFSRTYFHSLKKFFHLLSSLLIQENLNFHSQTYCINSHWLSTPREIHNTHILGQIIFCIFQSVYLLQQHLFSFHHVSQKMVLYINMLHPGMIIFVLCQ